MIAPLSWLKDYIDITLKPEALGERLTEVGLGVEKIIKEKEDTIFDLEITPNRPDWLCMVGVAREIAAIENKKIKYPHLISDLRPKKGVDKLPLIIHPNYEVTPRLTGIIISNVSVKESPKWLKEKLLSIGQKSINNIVDITNFVMWELGNPIHSFDYEKIAGHEMWVKQAKGGEIYESVDEITYHLPKGAIIFEDREKIFDLVGIKGGRNSGTYEGTKAVFIAIEVDNPVLIRKASQLLSLRSDASAIFERAVNKNGTIDALKRTVDLILQEAGGEIASDLIDLKNEDFKPWKLQLRLSKLEKLSGIKFSEEEVIGLLDRLNLQPNLSKFSKTRENSAQAKITNIVECTIPTYRNDLQIEEDLIEEVTRLYGYNKFPKTIPQGILPITEIPYFKDFRKDQRLREILTSCGFSEIYSYSLVSEKDLTEIGINSDSALRIDNPISRDFEYLRPTLKINLLKALNQNKPLFRDVSLFELGKSYRGKNLDESKELYYLSGITNVKNFYETKGILELIFEETGITKDPTEYIEILDEGIFFEVPYEELLKISGHKKIFVPIPKYPPIVEDITFVIKSDIKLGEIIKMIGAQSQLVSSVTLTNQYENSRTFHIIYQDLEKNLTNEAVAKIREKIITSLENKFSAKVK